MMKKSTHQNTTRCCTDQSSTLDAPMMLDSHDPQRERPRGDLFDLLNDSLHRDSIQTIPVRTGFIDTFFTGRHIGAKHDSCAQGLPPCRKVIAPRIEKTDVRHSAG